MTYYRWRCVYCYDMVMCADEEGEQVKYCKLFWNHLTMVIFYAFYRPKILLQNLTVFNVLKLPELQLNFKDFHFGYHLVKSKYS
jgi:uncharacterized Rmd1/YagE family protein